MDNLKTMGDLKNKDKKKEGNNKQSYVGGEKSGLLVEDNNDNDILNKIVNKAKN